LTDRGRRWFAERFDNPRLTLDARELRKILYPDERQFREPRNVVVFHSGIDAEQLQ
jgi:hypothetical protein